MVSYWVNVGQKITIAQRFYCLKISAAVYVSRGNDYDIKLDSFLDDFCYLVRITVINKGHCIIQTIWLRQWVRVVLWKFLLFGHLRGSNCKTEGLLQNAITMTTILGLLTYLDILEMQLYWRQNLGEVPLWPYLFVVTINWNLFGKRFFFYSLVIYERISLQCLNCSRSWSILTIQDTEITQW